MPRETGTIAGNDMTPEEVVDAALETKCDSISYTYTEPTIFMEYAVDTMKLARKKGLGGVFVSNGYTTARAFDEAGILPDANNVDLKAFTDGFYKKVCGARLEPVIETLKYLVKNGVWVEVTTLIIPGYNDKPEELQEAAGFIKRELGDFVPWHLSRFHPDYKLTNAPPTPAETLHKAYEIGKNVGLKYVYLGNVPHEDGENTRCPKCSQLLIKREGFRVVENKIKNGKCPACATKIEGVWGQAD
jgi:pyruvate formate lyase activating enzyme